MLVAAIVLNDYALSGEDWMVSDDAFAAFAIGALVAFGVCMLELRSARSLTTGNPTLRAVLAASAGVVAVIGGFLALAEPSVFNTGYQCLGAGREVWLAVAMRPTPATCGYLIPASDEPLFYPAAFVAFAAAALCAVSALFNLASRRRAST